MKLPLILVLLFAGVVAGQRLLGETRFEWTDPVAVQAAAAHGAPVDAIVGSMTRRTLVPRGLSLDVTFRDGVRFSWLGDAAMAPVGLVERDGAVYLVLQAWGRTRADTASGQPPASLVCRVREPRGTPALAAPTAVPLFVPTDAVGAWWPLGWRLRIEPEVVRRYARADVAGLLAQAAATSVVAGCTDLRRADHV